MSNRIPMSKFEFVVKFCEVASCGPAEGNVRRETFWDHLNALDGMSGGFRLCW